LIGFPSAPVFPASWQEKQSLHSGSEALRASKSTFASCSDAATVHGQGAPLHQQSRIRHLEDRRDRLALVRDRGRAAPEGEWTMWSSGSPSVGDRGVEVGDGDLVLDDLSPVASVFPYFWPPRTPPPAIRPENAFG
jgi:hypothetical protein